MVAATLVRSDVEAGLNLVHALDKKGFGVIAALWLYNSDTETWRMVIGYEGARKDLERKYLEAATISAEWRKQHPDEPILDLSSVRITSADDSLLVGLKPVVRVDGIGEIRFSRNMVNGIYVEDSLIHRLAA
ncbi:MAG: hypothetical protein Q8Q62_09630 [Mesorhizobium sp.]|nr:hypothetical protein [Mesorhizobium sp.]